MDKSRKEVEKEIEKEVEQKIEKWIEKAIEIVISVLVTFVITVVLFKFAWAWVIKDLFPGAVEQGLISEELTWWATVKFALFVSLVGGFYPTLMDAFKPRK